MSPRAFPGFRPDQPIPAEVIGSRRIAVALMQLEVHVEHIDQRLADCAAPRRVRLLLEEGLDVRAHVVGFQLFVVRPFGGHAVEDIRPTAYAVRCGSKVPRTSGREGISAILIRDRYRLRRARIKRL